MTTVRTTAELKAALAASTDPQTIEIAASESVDVAAIKAAAVTAERERITGINALAVKGLEEEISAAIADGTSVEATALKLFKASQDRGISLDGIKSDAQGAKGAGAKGGEAEAAETKKVVSAIVAGANRR